jgi:hypothetical protein
MENIMFKKTALILALLSVNALNATITYPENVTQQQVKEEKKVVVWDIHNVLAEKEMGTWAKIALVFRIAPKQMAQSMAAIAWSKITGRETAAYLAYNDMQKLPQSADASGEAYVQIFAQRGLHDIANAVEAVSNAYKPRPGMLEMVKAIHQKGITQRLASNIGPRLFENLKKKFKEQFKNDIFDYILPGKIVDYSNRGIASQNPESHLATIGKPNVQFYKEFNQTYHEIDGNARNVFTDDKLENTQNSTQEKWVGVHFDVKNKKQDPVATLKADFETVGILDK